MLDDNTYIGEYREEHVPDILRLFSLSFNKAVSKDWFFWKYAGSPWGSRGYVTSVNGKVIAFYGGMKLRYNFQGSELWAYQFCDVMTHPGYRARLFSKTPVIAMLGEMFYQENPMDFAFGFPSLRHARLQALRLGGKGYRLVHMYKKERLRKSLWPSPVKPVEGWELIGDLNAETDRCSSSNTSLRFMKDTDYFMWRFKNHPSGNYGLLTFRSFLVTKGHIIYTCEDEWLNVLDIIAGDVTDIKAILVSLENHVVRHMRHIRGIKAWVHPNEPIGRYFENLAYGSEDSVPIAFKPVNVECGVDADVFYEKYFYRMGDYDAS